MCLLPKAPKVQTPAPIALPPAVAPIEKSELPQPIENAPPPPPAKTATYFGSAKGATNPVSASPTRQAGFSSLRIPRYTTSAAGLNVPQ